MREKHLFETKRDFSTALITEDTMLRKCYFLKAVRLSKQIYKIEKALKITDIVGLFP